LKRGVPLFFGQPNKPIMNISLDHLTGVRYTLPFQTMSVPFSQLKKGDMVIEETGRETMDVWVFHIVKRINKKTITIQLCNQDGTPYTDIKPILQNIQSWNYKIRARPADE
jgi:hypothetical protein